MGRTSSRMTPDEKIKEACRETARQCDLMMDALKGRGFSQQESIALVAAMLSSASVNIPVFSGFASPPSPTQH